VVDFQTHNSFGGRCFLMWMLKHCVGAKAYARGQAAPFCSFGVLGPNQIELMTCQGHHLFPSQPGTFPPLCGSACSPCLASVSGRRFLARLPSNT